MLFSYDVEFTTLRRFPSKMTHKSCLTHTYIHMDTNVAVTVGESLWWGVSSCCSTR